MKKAIQLLAIILISTITPLLAQTNNVALPTTNHSSITTGSNNTSIGQNAGVTLTTGKGNIMLGSFAAGNAIGTKRDNVIIGDSAGFANEANRNILIGKKAGMQRNEGNDNVMIGYEAGWNNDKGESNIYIGKAAGKNTNDGDDNVFIGDEAGMNNEGDNNIFIGREAGKDVDNGGNNVLIGKSSGELLKAGVNNTYLGYRSGVGSINAKNNVAIGDSAGAAFSGINSVAIGSLAGRGSDSANYNVFVGANARAVGVAAVTLSNVTAIGNNAMVAVENAIILGDTTNADLKIGIGTASPRYRLDVKGVINMRVAYNKPGLNINNNEFIGLDNSGRVTLNDFRLKYANPDQWSDYVFAADYKLMPIKELEKFVLQNKHLPNIPSANDVVREGVNMNEITTKLLEKIEEQTLYIINLQKQIDDLRQTIEKK